MDALLVGLIVWALGSMVSSVLLVLWQRSVNRRLEALEDRVPLLPQACRVCGCTDDEACWPTGCHWVDVDLCSECVARAEG